MVGALMYAVCLSGTLAVFFPEFERWEQPYADEFRDYDPVALEQTFNQAMGNEVAVTPHMYLVLPTEEVPRARIANENESWFLTPGGQLGEKENNAWTEMLLDLHLYLHLPHSWGMILVSALGAILFGLVISGVFAHPRMFRDAFNLRLKGQRLLEQVDLHNRLSVWALPFHIMIGITGAYFGLALPILAVVSSAMYDGDRDAVIESVFGSEPVLEQQAGEFGIARALEQMPALAPGAEPLFITFHDAGEDSQQFGISAAHPGRLIYSENYLFDASGTFLRTDGFLDSEVGRQVVYSIYRLHFGHFFGLPVKIGYFLLGLALTVVSVTGINIWLARRKHRDRINDTWVAIVWGLPIGLVLAAISRFGWDAPTAGIVWGSILAACIPTFWLADEKRARCWLLNVLGATCIALVLVQFARYGSIVALGVAGVVNVLFIAFGVALLAFNLRRKQPALP